MPASCAFFAASNAACWAANGVPLREPRKPRAPADDCATRLPSRSVMEIMVLLKEAATWAMPMGTFFFSFLRKTFFFPVAFAILKSYMLDCGLLLARRFLLGDRLSSWALASASVSMRALAAN